MNCQQVRNKLIFYYYGELGDSEMKQVRDHLAQCDACRMEYNKLALVLDYSVKEAGIKAPDDIWDNIEEKLNTSKAKTKVVWLKAVQTMAAAAAIALAIFLGSLMGKSYVSQTYASASNQQHYEDYDSLVQAFTNLDESLYIVMDK